LLWHQPTTQLFSNLTSIEVAGTSVSLVDYVKLPGITFDKHLNFDKHIFNVCSSSYFHIRALRHNCPFLDSETSKTIACACVGSRLDYVNSILTGISSRNIHRLQHIQKSLARVVTRSTTNTTSALIHFIGFQFSNESILKWPLLSTVHSATLALNTRHLYYILIRHRVSFTLPPSISSPNLVSTLFLPLMVFDILALLFGIPSLIISDLPNLTLSSTSI